MDSGVEAVVVSALECIRLDHNYSCFIQSPQFGKRVDSATDTTTSGNESTCNDVVKSESDNDQDESTVEIPTDNTKTIIPKQPTRGRSTRSRSLSTSKVTVKEESDESVSSRTANDATSVSQQQQNVNQRSQRRRRKPKRWDDDSDDNTDTTSDRNNASLNKENEKQSEEEEEEEDPDKLWCICRRPHNNRFMICCDICEEWFHGKCVGVSVRQNKSFEKQGIKWLCPGCKQENESGASATTTTTTTTTAITNDKSPIKTEPIPFENTPIKEESDDEAMDDLSKDSPTNDSSGPLQSPLKSDADNLTSPPSISIASPKKSSIKSKQTSNEYSSNRKILSKKVNRDERDMKIGDVLRQRKLKEAGSKAAAIERKEANRLRKLIKSSKTSLKLKIDKSNKSHKHSETPQTPDAEKQENKWEPISKVVPLTKKVEEKKKKPKNTPMDFSFNDLFKADAPVMMTKKITPTSYASPTTPNTPNTPSSKRPILPGNTQQKKPIVEQNCVNCGKIVPKNSIRGKETSVYCSEPCLEKHVKASFDFVKQAKSSSSSSSSSVSPASSGLKTSKSRINLYDRITGRLLSEMVEFNEDKILEYIKNNPTYDIMKPKVVRRQSSSSQPSESESKKKDPSKVTSSQSKGSSSVKRNKEESSLSRQKSSESNSSKPVDKKEEPSGEMVRTKVRLELKQILLQRSKEANLKIVTEEVAKIAEKIEEELFNYFNKDPGQKYRTRFRSLRYNLSDTKNQGLFRKVLNSTINPVRLVRMSPEELAHSELAKWREREAKHSLEMIKRDAEAAAQQVIVKKTHKGEEVIEKKASLETLDPASDEELAKSNAKSNSTPPTTAPVSKEKPFLAGLELLGDGSLGDAEDNTDKHGQHLFDLHCKKCTNQNTNDSSTSLSHKNKTPPSSSSDSKPPQPKRVRVEFDEPTTKIYEEALKLSKTKKSREKLRMKVDDHKASASDSSTSTNQVKKQPLESCWKGFIHMPEVAKFVANAHTVHGLPDNKLKDVPDSINVVGRIAPEQALDYLRKKSPQDITVVKFVPVNLEERSGYEEFFRYLFQRKRYGVVDSANSKNIKDFYILPLPKDQEPPEAITPFNGPGLGGNRRNLLIGVLVRNRKPSIKTPAKEKPPSNGTKVKFEVQESSPSEKPERSYTPPPPEMSVQNETPNDEPYDPAIGLTPPQPPPPSEENDPPPPAPPPPQEEKPVDESEPYDPEENDLNFNCSIPFLSPSVFVNSTKFNFI